MAYRINGPTEIGDSPTALNTIRGNVNLIDITTTWGDLVFADTSNNLTRLAPGTAGQILQTNGAGADPSWVTSSASLANGFSARKTGTQTPITTQTTITTWSTASAPEYDTTGGDFVPATGVFTAGAAGTYKVAVSVAYTQNNNDGNRILDLYLNGTTVIYQKTLQPSGHNAVNKHIDITTQVSLAMNDTLVVRLGRTGTSTLTVQPTPETWWAMTKLS